MSRRAGGQRVDGLHGAAARSANPPYVLGIEHTDIGTLVGHVGLSAWRGSVEIGYAFEQQRQGSGLATESVIAMSGWALTELALPEVLGIVAADNVVDGHPRTIRIYGRYHAHG